ncbi:MAG: hypothetical protein HQL58_07145 [Magnetococcales bacterium]|nr:hypothetical protein [Magnetococcales bacterium]
MTITTRFNLYVRLIGLFLVLGLTPFLLVGFYSWHNQQQLLEQQVQERLSLIRASRVAAVNDYFNDLQSRLMLLRQNSVVIAAMKELRTGFALADKELGRLSAEQLAVMDQRLRQRYLQQQQRTIQAPDNAVTLWWPPDRSSRVLQDYYLDGASDNGLINNSYRAAHDKYHGQLKEYLRQSGLHDLLLVEPESGYVVYSTAKEIDFGTSLLHGPFRQSHLAQAVRHTIKGDPNRSQFADFNRYAPSFNQPAAFLSIPVLEGRDHVIGILVLQIASTRINELMRSDGAWQASGFGQSGDSFLLGSDFKFRSDPRPLVENPESFLAELKSPAITHEQLAAIHHYRTAVGLLSFNSPQVQDGLAGINTISSAVIDYRQRPVWMASGLVQVHPDRHWLLLVTMDQQEIHAAMAPFHRVFWSMAIIGILLVSSAGWLFARSVHKPLQQSIALLSAAATQMSSSSIEQERVMSQQLSAVTEIMATLQQLLASAKRSTEQAMAAAQSSHQADELSHQGILQVNHLSQAMSDTRNKVAAIAERILQLSGQSEQIHTITRSMTDFANETRMLSMNAAVEAVHAGEHGKGFAMLSIETRKLAEESKRSAKEIALLVQAIQQAMNDTVMVTDDGSKTVAISVDLADNTLQLLQEIVTAVGRGADNSHQIHLAIQQQESAVRQVVEAVQVIHAASREGALGMSQIKTGITSLNAIITRLREHI